MPLEVPVDGVEFDAGSFSLNARLVTYAVVNCFALQQRIMATGFGLPPDALMVYLHIGLATVQKFVRRSEIPLEFRGAKPLSATDRGSISRRALAAATGLPRETVRRIVADLILKGYVISVGNKVATLPEVLTEKQDVLRRFAEEAAGMAALLLQLGVLIPRVRLNEPDS